MSYCTNRSRRVKHSIIIQIVSIYFLSGSMSIFETERQWPMALDSNAYLIMYVVVSPIQLLIYVYVSISANFLYVYDIIQCHSENTCRVICHMHFISHWTWAKWPLFRRRHFQIYFLEWKLYTLFEFLWSLFLGVSLTISQHLIQIKCLATSRRQTIIWTIAGLVY